MILILINLLQTEMSQCSRGGMSRRRRYTMTNGDKLRNQIFEMSNEELAAGFAKLGPYCGDCPIQEYCRNFGTPSCRRTFLKWLKEEVTE